MTITLLLIRFCYSEMGTFGRLYLPGGTDFVYTVECPWKDNIRGISCIPEGSYPLELGSFNKPKEPYPTWVIPDGKVAGGRTLIKIHRANRAKEIEGCIAPGLALGSLHNEWAVLSSKPAHDRLMKSLHGAPRVVLEISYASSPCERHDKPKDGASGTGTRPLLP